MAELNQTYKVIDSLIPFLQVNALLNQEIEQLEQTVASLTPFVKVANTWAADAIQHEQVLDNLCWVMSDPEYLIYWAFQNWGNAIQPNGEEALQWIADEWMRLLDIYEQKYMAAYSGQHSPLWFKMQPRNVSPIIGSPEGQGQIPPLPPIPGVPGQSGGGPVDQLKNKIALYKSGTPDLAQQLQRQHLQSRQNFNLEVW